MTSDAENHKDRLAKALGSALQHAASEAVMLARLEEFFSPQPAKLASTPPEIKVLDELADDAIRLYGGAPRLIIQRINDPKPTYDTYMSAAIDEAIEVFHRSRRSLCRAQAFLVGVNILREAPELMNLSDDAKVRELFQSSAEQVFWENAETTFIRLAGFWDRLGQVLDFAFFSIRQYERDGFSAVVDRIRSNALRMRPGLAKQQAWLSIWAFKKSEKEDGLQWLLSRRNMLVHSLHLRPVGTDLNDELFASAFNHLDERLKNDLKPGTPEEEIRRLNGQLNKAAALLPQVLILCRLYAEEST
jgi:hypothetical protein